MKHRLTALASLVFVGALALTGCVAAPGDTAPTASVEEGNLLAEHDLSGLDAKQIIDRLDAMPVAERPTDLFASIRPDNVLLSDGGEREVLIPMPEDEFYVSMSPFVTQTHDCFFHSLTTCLGELQDQELHVTITDVDGAELANGTYRTFNNGFVGFWLPRGIDATITVKYEGKSVTAPLSTTDADPTCVTTLQLT